MRWDSGCKLSHAFWTTMCVAAVGLSHVAVAAVIWTVDDDGAANFDTIQAAVDAASNGDTIIIYGGTYYGSGDASTPVVDTLGKAVRLLGAPDSNTQEYPKLDGENVRRGVQCVSGETSDTSIENLTVTSCVAERGAGIYCLGAEPTILYCNVRLCTATDRAGGIYVQSGDPLIQSCYVTYNVAPYGGGYYFRNSSAQITGGQVSFNTSSGRGGAMRIYDGSPTVTNVLIQGNAAARGGGVYCQDDSATQFVDCRFINNSASSLGGAVACSSNSPVVLTNCEFTGNQATGEDGGQGSGGAIYIDGSTVTVDMCTLSDNEATVYGGAIYCWSGSPTITESTIQANSAGATGGGFYGASSSNTTFISNLICGNTPDNLAGNWTDVDNCIALTCDDEDSDGIIDGCDDDVTPTHEVPTEFATIAEAYAHAAAGDMILVHPGTHLVPLGGMVFQDKSVTLRSLDGAGTTTITTSGGGHVIVCEDLDDAMVIEGFKITGGSVGSGGGGLGIDTADVQVNACIIENNHAFVGGGIGIIGDCTPIFTDCAIWNNTALTSGGGFFSHEASAVLINCSISSNATTVESFGNGGGLNVFSGDVSLIDCQVVSNTVQPGGQGGGVLVGGVLHVQDSQIGGNTAPNIFVDYGYTLFKGDNLVEDTVASGTGATVHYTSGSQCTITQDLTLATDGAIITEVDDLAAESLLSSSSEIVARGCLTVANDSSSLLDARAGQIIDLMEASSYEYGSGSTVFPPMPSGLGLQVIVYHDGPRGGQTLGLEVIVVETPDFNDPLQGDLDSPPVDMAALDIDGDGQEELAVLFGGVPGSVWIYDVTADAPPAPIDGMAFFVGNVPVDIDAGDLDGDGDDDLIVANAMDSTLTILTTVAPNSMAISTLAVPGGSPTCAAIIDWDGNASLDAVAGVDVAGAAKDRYQVMQDLTATPLTGPALLIDLVDGDPDMPTSVSGGDATASWGFAGGTTSGAVHHAQQGGSLSLLAQLNGHAINQVLAQDLDDRPGDGLLDIVVCSAAAESLYIIPGTNAGFDTPIPINIATPVELFVALDADGDGDMDFFVSSPTATSDQFLLLRNGGAGGALRTLTGRTWSQQSLDNSQAPTSMESGKLDPKDEDDDWVLGGSTTTAYRSVEGRLEQTTLTQSSCAGDVNGSGMVDIEDLLLVLADYGNSGDGDANGDGIVTIEDLLVVLADWGQTC